MRIPLVIVTLFSFLMAPADVVADSPSQPPAGFVALFNGKDLTGWHGMGHFDPRKLWAMSPQERATKRASDRADMEAHWRVESGEIVNDGHGLYLTTDQEYGDIELLIDYKTVPRADSGIYLRGNPQVQIWDYTEEAGKWKLGADKGSGGLWNNSAGAPGKDPLVLADKPFGQWNSFRILQVGNLTTVYLNGKLVIDGAVMENFWDRSKPLWPRGPIQLQTHGGEIRWRNIFIREILPEEANAMLETGGFQSVFNGRDFTGWAGAIGSHEVVGGVLRCKKGQSGTLYTRAEYTDFIVRLEFRLSPGGNNGLGIRYPSAVDGLDQPPDPAYHGMCELQVLDNTAPAYAALEPHQYHGSAYRKAPAHRGFLRPVGQWNYQQVTVRGSTIRVDLNGTTILDCDFDLIGETFDKSHHTGWNRKSGHFALAGHEDPIEFRRIRIKRL